MSEIQTLSGRASSIRVEMTLFIDNCMNHYSTWYFGKLSPRTSTFERQSSWVALKKCTNIVNLKAMNSGNSNWEPCPEGNNRQNSYQHDETLSKVFFSSRNSVLISVGNQNETTFTFYFLLEFQNYFKIFIEIISPRKKRFFLEMSIG